MKAPDGGGSTDGLVEALKHMTDKLRKELMDRMDSLDDRVTALEGETERQAGVDTEL